MLFQHFFTVSGISAAFFFFMILEAAVFSPVSFRVVLDLACRRAHNMKEVGVSPDAACIARVRELPYERRCFVLLLPFGRALL